MTFLLPLRVSEIGGDEGFVGLILGVGMVAALLTGWLSGHLADRAGRAGSVAAAGGAQAAAFAVMAAASDADPMLILSGFGFGAGWAVFYLLTPLLAISRAQAKDRVKYLTIISGLMMLGIGLGPVLGRVLEWAGLSVSGVFAIAAGLSLIGAGLALVLVRSDLSISHGSASLNLAVLGRVLRTRAALPTVMIAIGGGIFGCLTSYQAPISEAIGVDYALFFAVFVVTVVGARLGLAGHIGRQPPYATAFALLSIMVAALLSWVRLPQSPLVYSATTVLFAFGYGLTYSVLNGIVANIEQQDLAPPALLVFPLAYFLGLYGTPFLGGWVIATHGAEMLLFVLVMLGLVEWCLAAVGLIRKRKR
ncbi:MAG: MFS transporter [Hyphomicrobiales bacterium]|nr:MFS transporter [Hyphomicrobiales bacterium]